VTAKLFKEKEEEKIHQFFMGLDDSIFGTVQTNILSIDSLANLSNVYSIVVQEEKQICCKRSK
jgi:hypothetical protein